MEVTISELRYRINKILKALARNEQIKILDRGKVKGIINPMPKKIIRKVTDHPLFGIYSSKKLSVAKQMDFLRKSR